MLKSLKLIINGNLNSAPETHFLRLILKSQRLELPTRTSFSLQIALLHSFKSLLEFKWKKENFYYSNLCYVHMMTLKARELNYEKIFLLILLSDRGGTHGSEVLCNMPRVFVPFIKRHRCRKMISSDIIGAWKCRWIARGMRADGFGSLWTNWVNVEILPKFILIHGEFENIIMGFYFDLQTIWLP